MMVKLLMSWDIKPDLESEYFEFVVREFVPGITKLGLQPSDAWLTLYGDCSQVHTSGIAENLQAMRQILAKPEWDSLHERLMEYVHNYQQKIVRADPGLQL
jgi:hypothetical protein